MEAFKIKVGDEKSISANIDLAKEITSKLSLRRDKSVLIPKARAGIVPMAILEVMYNNEELIRGERVNDFQISCIETEAKYTKIISDPVKDSWEVCLLSTKTNFLDYEFKGELFDLICGFLPKGKEIPYIYKAYDLLHTKAQMCFLVTTGFENKVSSKYTRFRAFLKDNGAKVYRVKNKILKEGSIILIQKTK